MPFKILTPQKHFSRSKPVHGRMLLLVSAFLLSLLFAQIATSSHGFEHLFHEGQALCQIYLASEHNSACLPEQQQDVSLSWKPLVFFNLHLAELAPSFKSHAIRAPPYLS